MFLTWKPSLQEELIHANIVAVILEIACPASITIKLPTMNVANRVQRESWIRKNPIFAIGLNLAPMHLGMG